ncbi:MAG: hypothetical protein OXE87_16670 [Chloroflexi bacterium]|nr:hypothetical protein [Chloroflexota bacterium]
MLRVKIYQQTGLEQNRPAPQYLELDEEQYADQLFLLPVAAAAKGVQLLLATDGPNAPLPLDADTQNIRIRRIVCTHPDLAGEVVIEFPSPTNHPN